MFSKKKLLQFALAGIVLVNTNMLFSVSEAADDGIHVDQVGYLTNHDKVAMVADAKDKTFEIIDTKTNKVVFTGKLSAPKYDAMSEETLSKADFTNLKTPGTYILKIGNRESYDFEINDNVYAIPTVQSWRSYTLSRSNTPIDDTDVSGLKLKGGHPQDKNAEVYFTDKLNKKGDVVDVSGGWYDAGDYGKYITTAGLSSAELMLAYEANPDHFTKGQLVFPKGVNSEANLPDVLSEVKFEIDWMRKMQRQDGSTFHKVAGLTWPSFEISPDTDTQQRYIFSTATYSSAIYGASLAIGARVYEPFDKTYAQDLKKDAERVWEYLQKNPNPIYRVDEGQENGSGPYNKNTDIEERLWLSAEMFLTTGDKKYENYLQQEKERLTDKPSFFTWDNTLALAQFAYAKAPNADKKLQTEVSNAFISYAEDILKKINSDGFECALAENEYTWASTKNALTQADILLMAYQLQPKQEYLDGALSQIHYLFGRNSLNKSFMTGVGDNPPEHPHNRIHESTGAYVSGLVVGGPNHVIGGDPDQTKYLESGHIPVAKSYIDVLTSWSTNEYAIDYTAAAVYALSWFTEPEIIDKAQLKLNRDFPSITLKK
ncbi:glycoside hydrolase family 9 protein [Megamonas hypermegale]|uniref:glycoside hydrolase family 9 protein n=1 Tax=Megamonas hypermegale TaxID=158847 RepID=UPI00255D07F2|nr:glycoside hydrolase family 9 protein [Megamonas hypermegale]